MADEQSTFTVDIQIIRDYVTLRDETLHALITQFGLDHGIGHLASMSPQKNE